MARKSQEVRLQQAIDTLTAYTEAGVGGRQHRFLTDMILRMGRKKYPTKGQREWLDRLIAEGVPEPKGDPKLIEKMMLARRIYSDTNRSWEASVLGDLLNVERQGWKFSAKQTTLRDKLINQSGVIERGEHILAVTPEMRNNLEMAVKLYRGYASQWQQERPALAKAIAVVRHFLEHEGEIEQYHYDKVINSLNSRLERCNNPRFSNGSPGYITFVDLGKAMVLCTSDMYIDDQGRLVNDWIMPTGEMKTLDQDHIAKR